MRQWPKQKSASRNKKETYKLPPIKTVILRLAYGIGFTTDDI
jgi:hypothetical protein